MAYTYNDFLSAANQAGMTGRFSQNDLLTAQKNPEYGISMLGLLQDIDRAGTDEQRLLATEAANQMRKNYGVYNIGDRAGDYGYASSYGSAIGDLMGKINNFGSFEYDPQKDGIYSAYKKQYLREGERAGANAMAQAAAASGGVPSSYAVTAGQQAGNYYAGQLADMVPTLEQNAYQRYLKDFAMLQDKLGTYQQQDATDYQRYLDAYNKQLQTEQTEYDRALTLYKLLGYATPEVAEILGIPADNGQSGGTPGSPNTGKLHLWDIGQLGNDILQQGVKNQFGNDKVMDYVTNMLDNAQGSQFDPQRVISGSNVLTGAEKQYANQILQEFLTQGYMKF